MSSQHKTRLDMDLMRLSVWRVCEKYVCGEYLWVWVQEIVWRKYDRLSVWRIYMCVRVCGECTYGCECVIRCICAFLQLGAASEAGGIIYFWIKLAT